MNEFQIYEEAVFHMNSGLSRVIGHGTNLALSMLIKHVFKIKTNFFVLVNFLIVLWLAGRGDKSYIWLLQHLYLFYSTCF